MAICACTNASALPSVTIPSCSESFGQIQKVIFQRIKGDTGYNSMTTVNLNKKATWTALLSASDGTKAVVSPYINAPQCEAGDARTYGGGNESLGGAEEIIGRNNSVFTGKINRTKQSVIKSLKQMQCESYSNNLGVYLIDENGSIGCLQRGTGENTLNYPIPIKSLFISDKTLGGYEQPDSNKIQWAFDPNWSDDLVLLPQSDMDFNPHEL